MAIIIPGSPGVPCNAKWYGATNVCPNQTLVCNFNQTGISSYRQAVTFLGNTAASTSGATCIANPAYITRTANNYFIDVWTAYRDGQWTSSTTIIHQLTVNANTSAPHMQAHINGDPTNPWYNTSLIGTGSPVVCATAVTQTVTITLYDDGSYSIA